MKVTQIITSSKWVDGSGWSYQDSIISEEESDSLFDTLEEVKEYCEDADSWGDFDNLFLDDIADGEDIQYTVTFEDEDGNEIASMSVWASDMSENE